MMRGKRQPESRDTEVQADAPLGSGDGSDGEDDE